MSVTQRAGRFAPLAALAGALLIAPAAHAGLEFPPPAALSEGGSVSAPKVALDAQGRATVTWKRSERPNAGIESVRVGADGGAGGVTKVTTGNEDLFFGPQVGTDPQGRATVVWERDTAPGSDSECFTPTSSTCVQALRLAADDTPGTLRTLAFFDTPEREPDLGGPGDGPQVVVDSEGRATVAWMRLEDTVSGPETRVQAVRLGADGVPEQVLTLSGEGAGQPRLALDPLGRATVVWSRFTGGKRRIELVRLGADGVPGEVKILFRRGQSDHPRVAVDSRGRATVVWRRVFKPRSIQAVRVGAGGRVGKARTLARSSFGAEVDVDPRGRATVVWERARRKKRGRRTVRRRVIQAVRLNARGRPGKVKTLSRPGAGDPQVAVDSRGRATVVWALEAKRPPRNARIQARRLRARGGTEALRTLSGRELDDAEPRVAVDALGRPTVVWWTVGGPIQATRGIEGP